MDGYRSRFGPVNVILLLGAVAALGGVGLLFVAMVGSMLA